ncbi:MAG: peptidase [Cyanobacteria bacterium RYN_339]|nr:peptidase [Cyanobacteria bacterium RYN_339]
MKHRFRSGAFLAIFVLGCTHQVQTETGSANSVGPKMGGQHREVFSVTGSVPLPSAAPSLSADAANRISPDAPPPPLPVTNLAATFAASPERKIGPGVFESKSDTEIADVISSHQNYEVLVAFKDQFRIRAQRKPGGPDELVSKSAADTQALNALFKKYGATIGSLYETYSKDESELDTIQSRNRELSPEIPNQGSWIVVDTHHITGQQVRGLVGELKKDPLVRLVDVLPAPETNSIVYTNPPTDQKFPQSTWRDNIFYNSVTTDDNPGQTQWYWFESHSIGMAWNYTRGANQKVAIIDNCFDTDNNDGITYDATLKRHFIGAGTTYDSNVEPTSDLLPQNFSDATGKEKIWHGSFCASLLGAARNNTIGLAGIAPECTVVPLKVFYASEIIRAINYAKDNGIKTISISLGLGSGQTGNNPENDSAYYQALLSAWQAGVTVVCSAGNDGQSVALSSLGNTNTIFVGATGRYGDIWTGSNYGPRVDMAAAGLAVSSSLNVLFQTPETNNIYDVVKTASFSGTSYSAPLVAGTAAMIRSLGISDQAKIRSILLYTADILAPQSVNVGYWDRQMSAGDNGNDGWSKVRNLNAYAACQVASFSYSNPTTYYVYKPGSTEYGQIRNASGTLSTGNWFPNNINYTFGSGSSIQTWEYVASGFWTGSTSIFKGGSLYTAQHLYGVPRIVDPYGNSSLPVQPIASATPFQSYTWSNQGSGAGWVDGYAASLP